MIEFWPNLFMLLFQVFLPILSIVLTEAGVVRFQIRINVGTFIVRTIRNLTKSQIVVTDSRLNKLKLLTWTNSLAIFFFLESSNLDTTGASNLYASSVLSTSKRLSVKIALKRSSSSWTKIIQSYGSKLDLEKYFQVNYQICLFSLFLTSLLIFQLKEQFFVNFWQFTLKLDSFSSFFFKFSFDLILNKLFKRVRLDERTKKLKIFYYAISSGVLVGPESLTVLSCTTWRP